MAGRGTTAVHGAGGTREPDGPLTPPIYRTSTFRFQRTADLVAASRGEREGFYTRYGHPSFEHVEGKHAALHGAEASVLFASGMAAFAGVCQALVAAGDRVVAQRDLYGGTLALLHELAERHGVQVTWVPTGDLEALEAALPGARLVVAESPTNPLLHVLDVEAIAGRAHAHGARLVVDATFEGPLAGAPLALGADLVLESATKSLAGHSDLLAGLVAGDTALCDDLRRARRLYGAVADPETAWLLDRGLRTLEVRTQRQHASALDLARRLEDDPRALDVRHVRLPSHPQRDLLARQAQVTGRAPGGSIVSFRCAGGPRAAVAFCDRLRLVAHAASLGGVESLVCLPCLTTHAGQASADRAAAGITDDLVRLSVGLEDLEDLWADIDSALR